MQHVDHIWAIVLAGGEGTRLGDLTRSAEGSRIPKQFWSPDGGPTLVARAIARARAIAPASRTVVSVVEGHRALWSRGLEGVPPENVVVQPENRGTALGVLSAFLHVFERDQSAVVVLLPSDHHVDDEVVLRQALSEAASRAARKRDTLFLLGAAALRPEPDLGWIVPLKREGQPETRVAFLEKPGASLARALWERGAMWNTLMAAASAPALLLMFDQALPGLMATVAGHRRRGDVGALYASAEARCFSRDVLERCSELIGVVRLSECGWSDLGTPERLRRHMACHGQLAELGAA